MLAVIAANLLCAYSSLSSRDTLRQHGTIPVTAAQMLGGTMILSALSAPPEPVASALMIGAAAISGLSRPPSD